MKNHKLLLKLLQQPSNQGITLTELLVALVISGIVLTATASGFMNVLRANRDVDSKGNQLSNLTRALTFIQEDIKQGVSVTQEASGGECDVTSDCLVIKWTDGNEIYYGFEDISAEPSHPFLKPGLLKRKDINSGSGWEVVADGLAINAPNPDCDSGSITWNGDDDVYGENNTGFRFCLNDDDDDAPDNRLVRIFLYGHIIDSDTPMNVDVVTFARSKETE